MKLSPNDEQQIINGTITLVPMRKLKAKVHYTGREVFEQGLTAQFETEGNLDLDASYSRQEIIDHEVNHKRRIRKIIAKAKNMDHLTDLLAVYVVRNQPKDRSKSLIKPPTNASEKISTS